MLARVKNGIGSQLLNVDSERLGNDLSRWHALSTDLAIKQKNCIGSRDAVVELFNNVTINHYCMVFILTQYLSQCS